MTESDDNLNFDDGAPVGVWVFIAMYLCGLLSIGVYYGYINRGKTIKAVDHFLAGRNLGYFTAMLSLYASSWSGYTEVGAPGDGYRDGFTSLYWIPGNLLFAAFIGWFAPRVHFYAHRRGYEGTADFISDRYRNDILSVVIVLFQIFPVILYVMGQITSVGVSMSTMTGYVKKEGGHPWASEQGIAAPPAALIFVCIMFFYEFTGGMAAIAKTDVIQAGILLCGFLLYFILHATLFKGLPHVRDVYVDCANLYEDNTYKFAALYQDITGKLGEVGSTATTTADYTATKFLGLTGQPNIEDLEGVWPTELAKWENKKRDALNSETKNLADKAKKLEDKAKETDVDKQAALQKEADAFQAAAEIDKAAAAAAELEAAPLRIPENTTTTKDGKDVKGAAVVWWEKYVELKDDGAPTARGEKTEGFPMAFKNKAYTAKTRPETTLYMSIEKHSHCSLVPGEVIEPAACANKLHLTNTKLAGWMSWNIASIPFVVYPHIMDRYYGTRDVKTLKAALHLTHISFWISGVPSIFMGITTSVFPGMGNRADSNKVWAQFIVYMTKENAFLYLVGCLITSAAFAAYMSTADSGLMGFSSMITLDIAKHYFPFFNDRSNPNFDRNLVYLGKFLSVVGGTIAWIMSTSPTFEKPLGDLYIWQGSFLMCSCPAFFFGMLSQSVCSWGILSGAVFSMITVVKLNIDKQSQDADWAGPHGDMPNVFWGLLVNICCTVITEAALRLSGMHPGFEPESKPDFQGLGPLPIGFIGLDMSTVGGPAKEPWKPWWASVLVCVISVVAIPYWAVEDPPTHNYSWVGGIPWWGVVSIFLTACASTITILQCEFMYDDWMETGNDQGTQMAETFAPDENVGTADFQQNSSGV